ncbi:MAG: D-alanyl-D-alanine carboxypeptidase [Candidatus Magasanikbacteria bacterium]|nr:D-alanyl-D-alanine carboxypeptidase [Candidatus Magasanikbacteria bacterium]
MPSTTWENLSFTGRRPLIVCVAFLLFVALGFGLIKFGIFLSKKNVASAWSGFASSVAEKVGDVKDITRPKIKPEVEVIPSPKRPVLNSGAKILNPADFTGRNIVVRDSGTGKMLYGKAAYDPWPMASVTKLLSALVLLDAPINFASTTVAAVDGAPDNDVAIGATYYVKDLWNAGLISSSNRAVLSLADSTGLTREEFVGRMNEKARQLGMTGTKVVEPTGLDARNQSTAADIAVLLAEALRKPEILESVRVTTYNLADVNGRYGKQIKTTDWLLSGAISNFGLELVGGKTGYIPESGYNFAAETVSSTNHVVVVVLGARSIDARFTEARRAAEWAYQNFTWK